MSVSSDNVRISVTVSKEIAEKLDNYSSMIGMNRSALCCYFIGQSVIGVTKAMGLVDDLGIELNKSLVKDLEAIEIEEKVIET